MDAPKFTASRFGLYELCPTAYARELELAWFCADNDIAGPDTGSPLADRGVKFHAVLADIPYTGNGMGPAGFKFWPAVHESCEKHGITLRSGDAWFIRESINRRNILLDHCIEQVRSRYGSVGRVEILNDTTRLHIGVDIPDGGTIWPSGRPDYVAVIYDGSDVARLAFIADYKSGYAGQGTEEQNAQLRTLSILVAAQYPSIDETLVSLLARADMQPGEVTGYRYGIEALGGRHFDTLRDSLHASSFLAQPFFDKGAADTDPKHQQLLHESGNVGDHCENCKGKACCSTIREYLTLSAAVVNSTDPGLWGMLRARALSATTALKENPNATLEEQQMTIEELARNSAAVTEAAAPLKLANAVREDINHLIRQVVAKGQTVPQHSLRNSGFTDTLVKNEQGEEPTPVALCRQLIDAGLLPGKTLEDALLEVSEVNGNAARDLVAACNGISSAEAMKLIGDRLQEVAPLKRVPKTPVVVYSPAPVEKKAEVAEPERVGASTPLPKGRRR